MVGAIDSAVRGLDTAFRGLDETSRTIARDGVSGDVPGRMVDLVQARHQVRANAAVIRTADKMIGSIIDVLA